MISLCFFVVFDVILNQIQEFYLQITREIETISENSFNDKNIEIMKESNSKEELEKTQEDTWQVEIPKINLIAPISEGTSQQVMLEFVGHFENTSDWEGNIGLAAHNRGYPINYFARLKELINGDNIIYKTNYGTKTYLVETSVIIEDTDWSYLQNTEDNRITLITCVENQPSKRLCIQAIEI